MTLTDALQILRSRGLTVRKRGDTTLIISHEGKDETAAAVSRLGTSWAVWRIVSFRRVEMHDSLESAVERITLADLYARSTLGADLRTRPVNLSDYLRWKHVLIGLEAAQTLPLRRHPLKRARLMYAVALRMPNAERLESHIVGLTQNENAPAIASAAARRLDASGHPYRVRLTMTQALRGTRQIESAEALQELAAAGNVGPALSDIVDSLRALHGAVGRVRAEDRTDHMVELSQRAAVLADSIEEDGLSLSDKTIAMARDMRTLTQVPSEPAEDEKEPEGPTATPLRPARAMAIGGGRDVGFRHVPEATLSDTLAAIVTQFGAEAGVALFNAVGAPLKTSSVTVLQELGARQLQGNGAEKLMTGAPIIDHGTLAQVVGDRLFLVLIDDRSAATEEEVADRDAQLRRRAWALAMRLDRALAGDTTLPTFDVAKMTRLLEALSQNPR